MMARAIAQLQSTFLTPSEVEASKAVMGLDSQLILDNCYYLAELDGQLAGSGGWSRRATLYGGDHSAGRDARMLDPATEPARIRAMYTDPAFARRGVGRAVLTCCEAAARRAGFQTVELMATLSGEPLYRTSGFVAVERIFDSNGGAPVPLVRMSKAL
ncbi:GNAT family N-acetyltransferase [Polymorphobacter fuscus]|nr:GNAT family N-acetyltransferase [Polymorphobacter fuscus]NJC07469.1 GNAT superfamily N-acetyltransferase [Polymorphobacter fuscus]